MDLLLILSTGYHVGGSQLSWDDSKAYCQQYGSNLATIKSSADHETVKTLCEASGNDYCWIGLYHDDKDAGSPGYKWTDGSDINFGFNSDGTPTTGIYPWVTGTPDNSDEDCVQLWGANGYDWNDAACIDNYVPICNYGMTHKTI